MVLIFYICFNGSVGRSLDWISNFPNRTRVQILEWTMIFTQFFPFFAIFSTFSIFLSRVLKSSEDETFSMLSVINQSSFWYIAHSPAITCNILTFNREKHHFYALFCHFSNLRYWKKILILSRHPIINKSFW